ncbi:MAG TPA: sigma 54-interacting transcriptional regulator [Firmicutes bacterium]|jgi:two-component system NtrC family response regulator|nr:sigma 54-interacting transcriptional regulator [Bacillota bacterium]
MLAKARFLIVDDEQEVCNFFSYLLKSKGYQVETANTGKEAIAKIDNIQFNAALVDLKLPDNDGLSILKIIKEKQPKCEVIIITGYSTVKSAVEAIQLGAFDYVEKPFVDIEEMEKLLEKALNVRADLENIKMYQEKYGFVIGQNLKMLNLIAAAQKIAKKNITVLILGETGTGKEVLARYIHTVSHRSDRPFMAFNCGAFTENLLESELFGHEKGSFTGAYGRKKGIFELAHRGTLFLDEIDSASPAIQVKLLRVLETGEFLRVGGEELCKADVRIIAATNANLQAKVNDNQFREDLFYRLDVASLYIPPLRERAEDIPLFVNFFLERELKDKKIQTKRFSAEALELMKKYPWPGNIRELANTVAQATLLSNGPVITQADLPPKIQQVSRESGTGPAAPIALPAAESRPGYEQKQAKEQDSMEKKASGYLQLFRSHPQRERLLELLEEFNKTLIDNLEIKNGIDLNLLQEDLKCWSDNTIKRIISNALDLTYGSQVKAAALLGITARALRYYLKEKN